MMIVANDLAANLDLPVSQCRHRPVLDGVRQCKSEQKVGEFVGQRMKLLADGMMSELTI